MRITILFVCVLSWVLEAQTSSTQDFLSAPTMDSLQVYNQLVLSLSIRSYDVDSALELVHSAVQNSKLLENDYLKAEAFDVMSLVLNKSGNWSRAVSYQDSAISIRASHGWEVELGKSYNHLGSIYHNEGQLYEREAEEKLAEASYNLALKNFVRALKNFTEGQDSSEVSSAYNNIGLAHYSLYDYEKALKYFRIAEDMFLQFKRYDKLGDLWNNMALVFEEQQLRDSAFVYYTKAAESYERESDYESWLSIKVNLAGLYSDDPLKAIKLLKEADSLAVLSGSNASRVLIQENMFTIYEREGNYKKALKHLKIYKSIKDDMLSLDFKNEELKVRYESSRQKEQIQRQKAENLHQQLTLQKISSDRQRFQIISLSLGLLFLISVGIFVWRRQVMRRLREQEENMHQQKLRELEQTKNLEMARAMLVGQEQERIRIAEDLHDRLGSTLSGAKMQMEAVASRNESENKFLDKSKDLIDKAIDDTREISHNLISGVLVKLGLAAALEDFKESLEVTNKLDINLRIENEPKLGRNTQLQLFRITQELVNNAVKHSGANEISITLAAKQGMVSLNVSDNGVGFDIAQVRHGLGLMNVERRVEALKAKLEVHSDHTGSCFKVKLEQENG